MPGVKNKRNAYCQWQLGLILVLFEYAGQLIKKSAAHKA
jgi:hypothetical protein